MNARFSANVVDQLLLVLFLLHLLGNGGQQVLQQFFILDVMRTSQYPQQLHPSYLQGLLGWNRRSPLRLTQEKRTLRETASFETGAEPSVVGVAGDCDTGISVSPTRESDAENEVPMLE